MNKKMILALLLPCLLLGCTVRGGWPRFLRHGEPSDAALRKEAANNLARLDPTPRPATPPPVPMDLTNALILKIQKRDGTNFLGVFMGMIAEWDGATKGIWPNTNSPPYKQGVMMFSATSGQLLRWISYEEFREVYVLKTKPEYPKL